MSPIIQDLSVNVQIIVIVLFFVMIGFLISPVHAQQFAEPKYEIRGGNVLGFEIDAEERSLIISLDARSRGELIISLPRNLIDAKIGSEDTSFKILVSGLNLNFFDETVTSYDRTVTIPFSRSDYEVVITGTQIFSQVPNEQNKINTIEDMIDAELRTEIPENNAKLLIFSDTDWTGALQSSSFDYSEIEGMGNESVIFECNSSLGREGIFGAKILKTTQDGHLTIAVIQNQKILTQGSTDAPFGEVLINGNCDSGLEASPGGCLIATATYGSEMAPQVQKLRELRDNHLLQTESGKSFMKSFNEFYYSFSPYIADYERENPIFKEMVRLSIAPMISSLSILNYVNMDSELEVLGYGSSLIILNLGMYVGIPIFAIIGLKKIHY